MSSGLVLPKAKVRISLMYVDLVPPVLPFVLTEVVALE
jgi:hypothetical protein